MGLLLNVVTQVWRQFSEPLLSFCEYDALPEIGHACGHNLIAEAGVAAGLGLKAALECEGALKGMVTVMGAPARSTDNYILSPEGT